jgi:hypothetical protein
MTAALAEGVRRATRSLKRAAELGDAEAIEAAVAERGRAVELLRARLAATDAPLAADLVASLALDAEEAEAALGALLAATREALAEHARGRQALTGYAGRRGDPAALDRQG